MYNMSLTRKIHRGGMKTKVKKGKGHCTKGGKSMKTKNKKGKGHHTKGGMKTKSKKRGKKFMKGGTDNSNQWRKNLNPYLQVPKKFNETYIRPGGRFSYNTSPVQPVDYNTSPDRLNMLVQYLGNEGTLRTKAFQVSDNEVNK